MSGDGAARSPEAAEASRRNGAKSRGPRTVAGKAKAAANSFKHGLFSTSFCDGGPVPPSADALAAELAGAARGDTVLAAIAVAAEAGAATATALLEELDARIDALIEGTGNEDELGVLIQRRGRIGRYQRRFRGQRDRAVRKCMTGDCSRNA